MTQKSKNIFQQAINAVSSRDEKAALEEAAKEAAKEAAALEEKLLQAEKKIAEVEANASQTAQKLAASEQAVTALKADLAKAQSEVLAMRTNLNTTQARANSAEAKLLTISAELQKYVSAADAEKIAQAAAEAEKAKILTQHTVKPDETLSHLALKYYHKATEPFWRLIYEANKDVIGASPSVIRPGMVLKIPVLPPELM